MGTSGFFSLVCVLLLAEEAWCQEHRVHIGIEGGPGIVFLRGNDNLDDNAHPAIGYSGGFFLQFNFSKNFSIRTNIAFEGKGMNQLVLLTDHYGNPLGEQKLRTSLNYLTMPLLLRVGFGEKVRFFVNAGPYFGYLLQQPPMVFFWHNYKSLDAGLSTGLGLSVAVAQGGPFQPS